MTVEQVLAAAMREPLVAHSLANALRSPLVTANPYHRQVAAFLSDWLATHRELPREGDYKLWTETLPEQQREGVLQALGQVQRQRTDQYTPEHVVEVGGAQLRQAAAANVKARLNQIDEVTPEVIADLHQELEEIRAVGITDLANLRHVGRYLVADKREQGLPSGSERLDSYLNGFQRGELTFLLADTGVGKTTALINFGQAAALHGAKVLHVTLELFLQRTAVRYYRRMAEAPRRLVRAEPEEVHRRAEHWWRYAKGEIFCLYRDPETLTPEDLRQLVALHSRLHWEPDMIIVDYLDLMAPSPTKERAKRHDQLGHASHMLRGLGVETNAAILSAAQATRPTGSKGYIESLHLGKMAGAYAKARAADVVLGLVQTPDEEDAHQARLQILKAREAPGKGVDLPMYFNRDLMLLADLDHANTWRIMRQLGHDPAPVTDEGEDEQDGE